MVKKSESVKKTWNGNQSCFFVEKLSRKRWQKKLRLANRSEFSEGMSMVR